MKKLLFVAMIATYISCTEKEQVLPEEKNVVTELVATNIDPYTGTDFFGSKSFFLVKKLVADSVMVCNKIFTNKRNGEPFSDLNKIYYRPTEDTIIIKFGASINKNILEFRDLLNADIKKKQWVIVSRYFDGGKDYEDFKIFRF